ncbi:MAG: pyridoxamine 5'-phosphate oxidase family protein [Patescibacteria group bacterium]
MNDLIALTHEALDSSYLMSLGVSDEEGVWVADVIFVHDDEFSVYWMSSVNRRHSLAIVKNPNVAAAITATMRPGEPDRGVQMSGVAEVIDSVPREIVVKHFRKRNKPEPAGDFVVLEDHQWYVLRPTRIELIDEVHFGYDRQRVR